MNKALLSSKKMDWCTPQDFFNKLDEEFHFTLDAAATDKTAKCPLYFTPETDGLKSSWAIGGGARCFVILRMVGKLVNGLKRHTEKRRRERESYYLFRHEQTQPIFMTIYTVRQNSDFCEDGYISQMMTAMRQTPHRFRLCW